MDILKKIKSATLIEALVATVLIVVIFIISSLIINNLLNNQYKNNSTEIENRLCELEYQYQFKKIKLPYYESFQNWEISIEKINNTTDIYNLEFKARNNQSKKTIIKKRVDE